MEKVWDGLYRQGRELDQLTNVPKALRHRLISTLPTALTEVTRTTADDGRRSSGCGRRGCHRIETVLMKLPAPIDVRVEPGRRATACGTSATEQAGSIGTDRGRDRRQVVRAEGRLGSSVSNIVFMGMGEPPRLH